MYVVYVMRTMYDLVCAEVDVRDVCDAVDVR